MHEILSSLQQSAIRTADDECFCDNNFNLIRFFEWDFFFLVYRPPNANAEFFDHLEKLIKQIDDENKEMHILGDLNCNLLEEKTLFNMPTNKLNSLYELYQLSQLINEPTWVTMTTSSLIDHVVINTPEKISHSGVVHTGISDNSLVYAIRKIRVFQKANDFVEIRNMKNFNEKNFVDELLKSTLGIHKLFR